MITRVGWTTVWVARMLWHQWGRALTGVRWLKEVPEQRDCTFWLRLIPYGIASAPFSFR